MKNRRFAAIQNFECPLYSVCYGEAAACGKRKMGGYSDRCLLCRAPREGSFSRGCAIPADLLQAELLLEHLDARRLRGEPSSRDWLVNQEVLVRLSPREKSQDEQEAGLRRRLGDLGLPVDFEKDLMVDGLVPVTEPEG